MPVQRKYDDEMRARAVRLYVERRKSDPAESQVASRRHVGGLIGVGSETLRGWVEREERNTELSHLGQRDCHHHPARGRPRLSRGPVPTNAVPTLQSETSQVIRYRPCSAGTQGSVILRARGRLYEADHHDLLRRAGGSLHESGKGSSGGRAQLRRQRSEKHAGTFNRHGAGRNLLDDDHPDGDRTDLPVRGESIRLKGVATWLNAGRE
jgi:transposase-like protein